MGDTLLKFRNRINGPLPIDLPGGNSISVAAKGYFSCTPEDAECPDVRRERRAGRISLVEPRVIGEPVRSVEKDPPLVVDGGPPSSYSPRKEGRPENQPPMVVGSEECDGVEKSGDSLTSSSEMMESEEVLDGSDDSAKELSGQKKKKKSSKRKKS